MLNTLRARFSVRVFDEDRRSAVLTAYRFSMIREMASRAGRRRLFVSSALSCWEVLLEVRDILEHALLLVAANDDVVEGAGEFYAGLKRHGAR